VLETPAEKADNQPQMKNIVRSFSSFFLELTETVVIGLSLFLVVYLFFMQPHQVNGQSMVPNFQSGEYVLTDKVSYRFGEPQRGDVVVFHAPPRAQCPDGTGCDFIKRIIGLPGETVSVSEGKIFIDGEELVEGYLPDTFFTEAGSYTQDQDVFLAPNEYFAVGDNRPHSSDSRSWGPVKSSEIVGRAFFRYWPASEVGFVEHYEYAL
jgi:signal peptidase I